jgi:hypothetical protein
VDCAQLSLCVQTVHNCLYAYRLCTTVTMHTDCAQLSLSIQTLHNSPMHTDFSQQSLCIQTVHNCLYAYRLCTPVTICKDCAQLSLCIQTVHNCHYAYISFTCLPHCCEVISSLTQNITSHSRLICDSKSGVSTLLLSLTVFNKSSFSIFIILLNKLHTKNC